MHFHLVSLFPEFFDSPLQTALMAKAREAGHVQFSLHNPREYGLGVHRSVDDRPYGGGPGMVLMLEPLVQTLRAIPQSGRILVMTPTGKPFTQTMAQELAKKECLTLVCGRYEGIDARLADIMPVEYVSMGDAVLNGGEVPALAIIEAVARLIPGFMGKEASGEEESFSTGLLEYPHYTRPEIFEEQSVPAVLRSGDHKAIAHWRRHASICTTRTYRPDMLQHASLTEDDTQALMAQAHTRLGRNLSIALVHHPVIIEGKNSGTSSLTNLDIHDIARISRTYGLGKYYIITPLKDQQEMLDGILRHWIHGSAKRHSDRAEALRLIHTVDDIAQAIEHITQRTGIRPQVWGSSAKWPNKKQSIVPLNFAKAREVLLHEPALLLLGTGHGLAPEVLAACDAFLPPLRFISDYNHLSVRAAAAILIDRILQDVF